MRDVLVRTVFGIVFLLVVFVPYVYDLQENGNLLTVVLYLFAMLGVHELFVMQESSSYKSNLKLPSLLLTTSLFLPLLINAFKGLVPIRQNILLDLLIDHLNWYWFLTGLFFLSLVFFTFLIFRSASAEKLFKFPVALAFFYPILPLWVLAVAYNFSHNYDKQLILIILLPIYLNDTLAYVSGRLFGKTPLIPSVSPKKTWEGFIGGIVGAALVMLGFLAWKGEFTGPYIFGMISISVSASILATLGDLFESKLKRSVGVKDSGKLIPGHGGILDRIDAMLFVTPVLYVILLQISK